MSKNCEWDFMKYYAISIHKIKNLFCLLFRNVKWRNCFKNDASGILYYSNSIRDYTIYKFCKNTWTPLVPIIISLLFIASTYLTLKHNVWQYTLKNIAKKILSASRNRMSVCLFVCTKGSLNRNDSLYSVASHRSWEGL